jgi:hypothetical protein
MISHRQLKLQHAVPAAQVLGLWNFATDRRARARIGLAPRSGEANTKTEDPGSRADPSQP